MLHKNFRVFGLMKTTVIAVLVLFCLSSIGYTQTKDVNTLILQLQDKNPDVRYKAARELGNLKDVKAVEPLIVALKDTDRFVRREAAWALGEIKDNRAVEPLITAMKDNDPDVRYKIVQALGKIGDARATKTLMYASADDNDTSVRYEAEKALGKIKDLHPGEAAEYPCHPVEEINRLVQQLKDKNATIRSKAEASLEKIGRPAVEPLIAALNDKEPCFQSRVISLLGNIKDKRAVEPLITALKDPDPDVRRDVVTALGNIQDIRVIEPLVATFMDANTIVQERASTVIGGFITSGAFDNTVRDCVKKHGYKIIYGRTVQFSPVSLQGEEPLVLDIKPSKYQHTIKFDNLSEEYCTVKLVGPDCKMIYVSEGETHAVSIPTGEYYILVRYGSKPEQYSYAKGDSFAVLNFGDIYTNITITLHKVVGGNYRTRSSSREEFDKASTDNNNTVTFDNQSGEYGTVKLAGPTARMVDVPHGQKRTVDVAAGEYYILVRYGSKPDQYSYAKGDPFTVHQTATQYSSITITLHKVVDGNYHTRPSSSKEFDKAVLLSETKPNDLP